ncbi:MAG: hypothetical protein AB7O65_14600 [Candidatus Korobacteraceae bacterium]
MKFVASVFNPANLRKPLEPCDRCPLFLRLAAFLLALMAASASGYAQESQNPSEQTAFSLVTQSREVLTGGTAVADLTLRGSVNLPKGEELATGIVVLKVKGTHHARLEISAGENSRSEIRSNILGEWIGADGEAHRMALHNTLGPAAWFAPHALLEAMATSDAVVSYIGKETRNGINVEHIRSKRQFPRSLSSLPVEIQQRIPDISQFSVVDLFLDAQTHRKFVMPATALLTGCECPFAFNALCRMALTWIYRSKQPRLTLGLRILNSRCGLRGGHND